MSIPVSITKLQDAVAQFGAAPFLLTVSDDGRPHAVGVVVAWDGGLLRAGVGARSAANAGTRPLVSLVWAPFEEGGYCLIVDGDAEVVGGGDGHDATAVVVAPTKAVLHRGAAPAGASAPGACGSDCVPL